MPLVDECRAEWGGRPEVLGRAVGGVVGAEGAGLDDHEARSGMAVPAERATGLDHVLDDVDVSGSFGLDAHLPEVGRGSGGDVGLGGGGEPAWGGAADR